jgi:hypothetical protein
MLILLMFTLNRAFGQLILNPTGTYSYQGKTTKKDGDTYGYFGTIQVKKLTASKIVMTFYICEGAPGYNSGSFVDTLHFKNRKAIYIENDCVTTFSFTETGIDVKETSHGSCWGFGVVAHGHFKRKSSKQPILTETLTGKKIQ